MIEDKKTSVFRGVLGKPKKEDVHIHSIKLQYECILKVSARYTCDYFRKAVHTIGVDHNVTEVVLGEGTFPVRTVTGIKKALKTNLGKNKIDIPLEEHVFIDKSDEIFFDHHGNEIKFQYKIDPKIMENYPSKLLEKYSDSVKKPEITVDAALEKLMEVLNKPMEEDVRKIKDELQIIEVAEYYIPVFEARLIGPKNKVMILRLDGVRNKIL